MVYFSSAASPPKEFKRHSGRAVSYSPKTVSVLASPANKRKPKRIPHHPVGCAVNKNIRIDLFHVLAVKSKSFRHHFLRNCSYSQTLAHYACIFAYTSATHSFGKYTFPFAAPSFRFPKPFPAFLM
jgi:hypothetical protein